MKKLGTIFIALLVFSIVFSSIMAMAMNSLVPTMAVFYHNETRSTETYGVVTDTLDGHRYVDLGLRREGHGGEKILFAACNIGANSPEEFGDFFQWGDTVRPYSALKKCSVKGFSFDWKNYPLGDRNNLHKYCLVIGHSEVNYPDGRHTLQPQDDVATVQWGGRWRMPDGDELNALIDGTLPFEWVDNYNSTGVAGLLVTGRGKFADTHLFLPAAGYCRGRKHIGAGITGHYWSRNIDPCEYRWTGIYAQELVFGERLEEESGERCFGLPVRPVISVPIE